MAVNLTTPRSGACNGRRGHSIGADKINWQVRGWPHYDIAFGTAIEVIRPHDRRCATHHAIGVSWKNLGDKEMVFMTIEFPNSANKPLAILDRCAPAA